jgi:O-methyltransferase
VAISDPPDARPEGFRLIRWVKLMMKSILHRLGYEVSRIVQCPDTIDDIAARTVRDRQYYTVWSAPSPLFAPWAGHPDFQSVYEGVAPHTVVSPDRCYILLSLARYAVNLDGDFAECGVYRGGTALLLSHVLRKSGKTLYLFDSFLGLPGPNNDHDTHYGEGDFADVSVEQVKDLLRDVHGLIDIRQGWIPETFAGLGNTRYAFVHVDVDLYQSALDCCRYFYRGLVPGGVLVFDEYGFPATRGERDAVDAFFADKPESPIVLPTGQAIVLKLPSGGTPRFAG